MLNAYLLQTQQLLSNPAAPSLLYSTSDLTGYINTARTQMAGECECIRSLVTLSVTAASQVYPFSSFVNLPSGVQGVYNARQMSIQSGTGQVYMGSRPYPWALTYWLNNSAPVPTQPTEWSQYGIGVTGSLVLNYPPNANYTLIADASCYPVALVTDSTAEAIPYPYTDAVCYFAAYYAYMSAQRQSDADKMYERYQAFLQRAKGISVPNVLPQQYDQAMPVVPTPQTPAGG